MAAPDGFVIVDKAANWTSHDVVARCRRLAATRKVGHAGTLDPMATGVLVVGVGRATRLLGHLSLSTKGYDATIRLGQSTVTDDAEGEVLESRNARALTDAQLHAAVRPFVGNIQQVPSSVSAIKINGERAFKRVRDGEAVDLAARSVTVMEFAVGAIRRRNDFVDVDVHVECSTGTYVRALARDLGSTLEVGGHLSALRRTRVGPYALHQARTLEQLADDLAVISLAEVAAANFATYTIDSELVFSVRNGRALHVRMDSGDKRAATPSVESPTYEAPQRLIQKHAATSDVLQGSVAAHADARKDQKSAGRGKAPADPEPIAMMSPDGEFLALYAQHGPVAHAVAVFAPTPPGHRG